jgi:hypothetical protein
MAILLSELLKDEEDYQPTHAHTHENREREMNLQINSAEVQPQTPDLDGGGIQDVTTQSLYHFIHSTKLL